MPWFDEAGGTEPLGKRLDGLRSILNSAEGRTVLDIGCGEGLISRSMIEAGAASADAVGIVERELVAGARLCSGLPISFHRIDISDEKARDAGELLPHYGIVLALSVAQKLPDPAGFLRWAASRCNGRLAIRVPRETFRPKRGGPLVSVREVMEGSPLILSGSTSWGAWYGIYEVTQ